ncbi:MAG: tetratricopeptide repeat protein, partial [Deltaproteobacteria bacterium]|nr:tetratricopeptide repeat protein [Deltaproteobacteria bacterium]
LKAHGMKKNLYPSLLLIVLLHACGLPKTSIQTHPKEVEELASKSKASYEAAQLAKNKEEILIKTQEGLSYAEACLKKEKNQLDCLYYQALNRGLLTKNHIRGYQDSLKLMVKSCSQVLEIKEDYSFAGCHRFLGNLYAKAPRLSLQKEAVTRDMDKALYHLKRAVELAPDYALNQLFYARTLFKAGELEKAKVALHHFETLLSPSLDKDYPEWKKEYTQLREDLS